MRQHPEHPRFLRPCEVTKPQDESSTSQADNSDGEQAPETEVGSPENETNALARKGDSKRHRPTWMKKLDLRKVKKSPTSTEPASERPSTSQQHLQVAVEEGAVAARPGPKFHFKERLDIFAPLQRYCEYIT